MVQDRTSIAILGAGIQGVCIALELARRGVACDLYDQQPLPLQRASRWNEGKIHLGYVYAMDTSMRTLDHMIEGALWFWDLLGRWIDLTPDLLSSPFQYLVPHDSALEPDAIECHFSAASERHRLRSQDLGLRYLGQEGAWAYEPIGTPSKAVAAAYQTQERSIDPHIVGDRLSDAVAASEQITFHPLTRIEGVSRENGGLEVASERGAATYDQVVNCLWEDRLRVDRSVGAELPPAWVHRYKSATHIPTGASSIPSVTLMVGPYGDVVSFPSGQTYLSWYPTSMRGLTSDLTPQQVSLSDTERAVIAASSLEGLAAFVPEIEGLPVGDARVEGGYIFGLGSTDITDPDSGLHKRFANGPISEDGYHSVDTGKYTTAPLFADMVADRVTASS